jgi:hypothetical protein
MAQLIMTNQQKYAPSDMVNDVPDILMEVPMHVTWSSGPNLK